MLLNHKGKQGPHPPWSLGTHHLGPCRPCRVHTVISSGPFTDGETVNPGEGGFPQITCRECVSAAARQPDLLQGLLRLGALLTPAAFHLTQKMGRSNTPK